MRSSNPNRFNRLFTRLCASGLPLSSPSRPSICTPLSWPRFLSCPATEMAFACSARPSLRTWRPSLAKLVSPPGTSPVSQIPLKPLHLPFNGTVPTVPPLPEMFRFLPPLRLLVTWLLRFEPLRPMPPLLIVRRQRSARSSSPGTLTPTRMIAMPPTAKVK